MLVTLRLASSLYLKFCFTFADIERMANNDIAPQIKYLASLLAVQTPNVPTKDELQKVLKRYQSILELLCKIRDEHTKEGEIIMGEFSFV
jgi:hypothetical protein